MNIPRSTPWHSLDGKNIWITGGAGYFGAVITAALNQACRQVVCFDLADRAATLIAAQNLHRTIPVSHNLADADSLQSLVATTVDRHGLPDGLVHLSYATHGADLALVDLPAATFARTLHDNLTSTFVLCRELAERMKTRGSGSVVLFSSMYGMVAPDPKIYLPPMTPNPVDYGASKAAVLQMARYFAMHYGPNAIRFNCVTPGPFPHPSLQATDPGFIERLGGKTVLQRIGQAAEMVGPPLFLLTDSASYVTGQNLVVDGGWTTW